MPFGGRPVWRSAVNGDPVAGAAPGDRELCADHLVAGLRMSEMIAPMVLDGPINGNWFETYVAQVLVPVQARRHRHHG